MIKNHDRSGWIGASDTAAVMGRWDTKSFQRFWLVKLGLEQNTFASLPMKCGTYFEHKILDACGIKKRDRQIRLRRLRLRVNLDGESSMIHEVKTYGGERFKLSRAYWMQAQVEMLAAKKPLEIVAYRLLEEDYINWLRPIDKDRITRLTVPYDEKWIQEMYLPRLRVLAECIKKGRWPDADAEI